jgi:CheY-like chemotaxis protein
MAATGEYRAVLMDCQMPMMDGFQATAELRRHAGPRHTPVIAMTASALIEDRQRCLDAGMDDFIAKPIDPAVLDRVLDRWIDAAAPAGDTAEPDRPSGGVRAIAEGIDDRLSLLRNGAQPVPEDLASRLVAAVREQVPASLARIDAAVQASDAPTVAALAHDLIGVAGNIGADELASECARLQFVAGAGDMAPIAAAVAAVRAAFGRTEQALDLITV